MRAIGAWMLVVGCIVAGVGWLDLLRRAGVLALGPGVPGALPLERLAREDSQPLARMVLAWLPTGALAGLVLAAGTTLQARRRAASAALVGAALLVLGGAAADAVAVSGSLLGQVPAQLLRAGTWVAIVLIGLGALVARPRAPAGHRAPSVH